MLSHKLYMVRYEERVKKVSTVTELVLESDIKKIKNRLSYPNYKNVNISKIDLEKIKDLKVCPKCGSMEFVIAESRINNLYIVVKNEKRGKIAHIIREDQDSGGGEVQDEIHCANCGEDITVGQFEITDEPLSFRNKNS